MKVFPVCGQSCGQSRFSACFHELPKSRKRPCRKAFRASAFLVVDSIRTTPKCGALPTGLHPEIQMPGYYTSFIDLTQVIYPVCPRRLHFIRATARSLQYKMAGRALVCFRISGVKTRMVPSSPASWSTT